MFGLIIQKLLKDVDPHHGKKTEGSLEKMILKVSVSHFMVNNQCVRVHSQVF